MVRLVLCGGAFGAMWCCVWCYVKVRLVLCEGVFGAMWCVRWCYVNGALCVGAIWCSIKITPLNYEVIMMNCDCFLSKTPQVMTFCDCFL